MAKNEEVANREEPARADFRIELEPAEVPCKTDERRCVYKLLGIFCHCCYRYKPNQMHIRRKDYTRSQYFGEFCIIMFAVWMVTGIIFLRVFKESIIPVVGQANEIGSFFFFLMSISLIYGMAIIFCTKTPPESNPSENPDLRVRFIAGSSSSPQFSRENRQRQPHELSPTESSSVSKAEWPGRLSGRRPLNSPRPRSFNVAKPHTSRTSPMKQQKRYFKKQKRVLTRLATSSSLSTIDEESGSSEDRKKELKSTQISYESESSPLASFFAKDKSKTL